MPRSHFQWWCWRGWRSAQCSQGRGIARALLADAFWRCLQASQHRSACAHSWFMQRPRNAPQLLILHMGFGSSPIDPDTPADLASLRMWRPLAVLI